MLLYFKTKKIKYFLDPPPQKKGAGILKVAIWLQTWLQPVTWIFSWSILSDSTLKIYKVILSSKINT